ncbi:MAG: alginate lyase family protein, partial [Lacunisphaera sp.]
MDHAQAVPGRNNGRDIGLIETHTLPEVIDSLALLATSPSWSDTDRTAFKNWLETYFTWLLKSANGIDERRQLNNHGTWYDVQAAYLALALGKTGEATDILTTALQSRLSFQVEPDGSQPRELVRTKSFEYSLFNLEALFACAQLSDHAGVDWWNFSAKDGRSLRAALAYLAPYADPAKPWPKKDLGDPSRTRLLPFFAIDLAHHSDPEFRSLLEKYAPSDPAGRWRLLWDLPASMTRTDQK